MATVSAAIFAVACLWDAVITLLVEDKEQFLQATDLGALPGLLQTVALRNDRGFDPDFFLKESRPVRRKT